MLIILASDRRELDADREVSFDKWVFPIRIRLFLHGRGSWWSDNDVAVFFLCAVLFAFFFGGLDGQ